MDAGSSLPANILSFTETAKSVCQIQQAHAHMLKTGIYSDAFASSKLVAFAARNPDPVTVSYAHSILSHIPNPNSFAYNSLIRAYANINSSELALFLFEQMLSGPVYPDNYSFTFALKACAGFEGLEEGKQIHGLSLKSGIESDVFVANTLIHVYGKSGCFELARKVLDKMPHRDTVSWNALLSAYVEKGLMQEAHNLFDEMEERNSESWNFMISGYVDAGMIMEAREIFDRMSIKNVVSWNAIITGYAHMGFCSQVLELFRQMLTSKEEPDSCTLANVLSACSRLGALDQGEWVHVYIDKKEIAIGGFLATALVDMYSKCGKIDKAREVFRTTSNKDVSTWNSMISGLSIHGFGEGALEIFSEMLREGVEPNDITFVSVLSACSHAGLLNKGREIFDLMVDVYKIQPTIEHYGCLVDLLGRTGNLNEAEELVNKFPPEEASVMLESLLGASKRHGNTDVAVRVANRLLKLNPNASSSYVHLSSLYASDGRWDEVMEIRRKMRTLDVAKEPGCSRIEINGRVHEFLAGEGIVQEQN